MQYGKKKPGKGEYTTPAIRPMKPGTKPVPESGKVTTMPVGPIKPFNPSMGAKQAAIEVMRKKKRP